MPNSNTESSLIGKIIRELNYDEMEILMEVIQEILINIKEET